MLLELTIRDFIIIDKVNVKFDKCFNVLTGETGAGKSILIQAVNLALGQKLKNGAAGICREKAVIELVFDVAEGVLNDLEIDPGYGTDEGLLVVSREIYANGKSVSRLNGQIISLGDLRPITARLIDIHGQHMHQSLLDVKSHLEILDRFGTAGIQPLKDRVAQTYSMYREVERERDALLHETAPSDLDYLAFQLKEIEQAKIDPEVDRELEEQFERFEHLEVYLEGLDSAAQALDTSFGLMTEARRALSRIESMDPVVSGAVERLESSRIEIEDLRSLLVDRAEEQDFDPQRFKEMERRIDTLHALRRKYGPGLEDILEHREALQEKIAYYQGRDERLKQIELRLEQAYTAYSAAAEALSVSRMDIALQFADSVVEQARSLNLPDLKFMAQFERLMDGHRIAIGRNGCDQVQFLLSTNLGIPPMPLTQVASGGEISRIMLGIKAAMMQSDSIGTMIFDEIDTGISGETAYRVGQKMRMISRDKQLVAITHLPQIAAASDRHFRIEKLEGESVLSPLTDHEHIVEVARIMSGERIDDAAIESSKELIRQARNPE